MSRLDEGHQRYRLGLKMGPNAHCHVLLHEVIWIPEIPYMQKMDQGHQRYRLGLKMGPSVQQIPEIEYCQKVSSHAQI